MEQRHAPGLRSGEISITTNRNFSVHLPSRRIDADGTQNIAITVVAYEQRASSHGRFDWHHLLRGELQQLQGTMDNMADGDIVYALDGLNFRRRECRLCCCIRRRRSDGCRRLSRANVTVGSSSGGRIRRLAFRDRVLDDVFEVQHLGISEEQRFP